MRDELILAICPSELPEARPLSIAPSQGLASASRRERALLVHVLYGLPDALQRFLCDPLPVIIRSSRALQSSGRRRRMEMDHCRLTGDLATTHADQIRAY